MDEEPREEQADPGIGYFPPVQPLSDETIRWQLDPTETLDKIKYHLKAYVFEDGEWKKNFDAKPKMTNEGINSFMGIVEPFINKNVVLSNLKHDELIEVMKDVGKTLRMFLIGNYKKYEIAKKDFNEIYYPTDNHIYLFLLRAKDNGERKHLRQTHSVSEVKQTLDDSRSRKRLGVF